jgi:hypothetical protein
LTSQEFSSATFTLGAVCVVVDVALLAPAEAVTLETPSLLWYAVTLITDLAEALVVTRAVEPASAAVACLVHNRPRTPLPSVDWSNVQPTGLDTVAVVLLMVIARIKVSPALTAAGMTTGWELRLPAVEADPT